GGFVFGTVAPLLRAHPTSNGLGADYSRGGLHRPHPLGVMRPGCARSHVGEVQFATSLRGAPRRSMVMADYPLIADHGLIGDLQTAPLVSTDGSTDWFCAPRFDSPSIFGALLVQQRGGHFWIRPCQMIFTTKQLYFPDTAILVTRYM